LRDPAAVPVLRQRLDVRPLARDPFLRARVAMEIDDTHSLSSFLPRPPPCPLQHADSHPSDLIPLPSALVPCATPFPPASSSTPSQRAPAESRPCPRAAPAA